MMGDSQYSLENGSRSMAMGRSLLRNSSLLAIAFLALLSLARPTFAYSVFAQCLDQSNSSIDDLTAIACSEADGANSAQAAADLSGGRVTAKLTASVSGATAAAILTDTITLVGDRTGGTEVVVTLSVDGSFEGDGPIAFVDGLLSAFPPDPEDPFFLFVSEATIGYSSGAAEVTNQRGAVSGISLDPAAVTFTLALNMLVPEEVDKFQLNAIIFMLTELEESNGKFTTADFAHTAQLAIEVPPGISWTSESGVLLSTVPEPTVLALMGIGLVGIRYRRRMIKAA